MTPQQRVAGSWLVDADSPSWPCRAAPVASLPPGRRSPRTSRYGSIRRGGTESADCFVANVVDPFNAANPSPFRPKPLCRPTPMTPRARRWPAAPARTSSPRRVPSEPIQLGKAGLLLPLDDYAAQFGWAETVRALGAQHRDSRRPALQSADRSRDAGPLLQQDPLRGEGWEVPKTLDELMTLSGHDRRRRHHSVRARQRRVAPCQRVVRRRGAQPWPGSPEGLRRLDRQGEVDRSGVRPRPLTCSTRCSRTAGSWAVWTATTPRPTPRPARPSATATRP